MLGFLKKWFSKEEKIEEITFSDLDNWLSENSRPVLEEFARDTQSAAEEFIT